MKQVVHPTFNPWDKLWFTDDGVVAESIRELLELLPPGTEIQDYYPIDRVVPFIKPRGAEVAKVSMYKSPPPKGYKICSLPEPQKETIWETITEDNVRTMNEELFKQEYIQVHVEEKQEVESSPAPEDFKPIIRKREYKSRTRKPKIVAEFKKLAPHLPYHRLATLPDGRTDWSIEDENLRKLWKDGLKDQQIADELGITKNSVIGRRHRIKLYREE